MNVQLPEPTTSVSTRAEVFLGYPDYFRSQLVSKLEALPGNELRSSRLPSGWTPIELLKHLAYVDQGSVWVVPFVVLATSRRSAASRAP